METPTFRDAALMADVEEAQAPVPDIMNDPEYTTNLGDGDDGTGDADTCRICRAEGSDAEPLFHPCKCSGSIKYVHQDCLMEWLSHSQKKHCELCKTAFRFTKLYSPNMPPSLPLPLLLRHVVIHSVKNFATWLRSCLVVAVWLGVLPFTIRQVWRFLFWFSDGGWPSNYQSVNVASSSTNATETIQEWRRLISVVGNGTSPVTPLQSVQTTSAGVGSFVEKVLGAMIPVSQSLNISNTDPLATGFLKSLYYGLGAPGVNAYDGNSTNSTSRNFGAPLPTSTPSLLSEVGFLRNLTSHPSINQLVITIAEGYVITLLVVVSFILVFLIREWVVQQQPGINMGAGFNAEFAAPDRQRDQQPGMEQDQEVVQAENEARLDHRERRGGRQRPIAQVRRRNNHVGFAEVREPLNDLEIAQDDLIEAGGSSGSNHRPAPMRDALAPAAEIQRVLTEEPRMTEEFLAIWRRADSNPQEVLRIIEREDKSDQMRYWVNAMKALPSIKDAALGSTGLMSEAERVDKQISDIPDLTVAGSSSAMNPETRTYSSKSNTSSESWEDIEPLRLLQGQNPPAMTSKHSALENHDQEKGKGRAVDTSILDAEGVAHGAQDRVGDDPIPFGIRRKPELNHETFPYQIPEGTVLFPLGSGRDVPWPNTTRPRATSDGPQLRDSISPLANNNWSFANLTPDDDSTNTTQANAQDQENRRPAENRPHMPAELAFIGSQHGTTGPVDTNKKAWKVAQDLRVQQVIEKAREDRKSARERHQSTPAQASLLGPSEQQRTLQDTGRSDTETDSHDWDDASDVSSVGADHGSAIDDMRADANPFRPEAHVPAVREPILARPAEPEGLLGNIAEYLWGGTGEGGPQEDLGANDEHVVHDLAAEAPFVPLARHDAFEQGDDLEGQDQDVLEAAIAAGIDPNDVDAIEDGEDFEGIMELIGMRGPIFGLVQNALFSVLLLSLTVVIGVWTPYNIGRISLLLVANPGPAFKLPLRLLFGCAAYMQDLAVSLLGIASYLFVRLISLLIGLWSHYRPGTSTTVVLKSHAWGSTALSLSSDAADRIMNSTQSLFVNIFDSEMTAFSAASHESLMFLRSLVLDSLTGMGSTIIYTLSGNYRANLDGTWATVHASMSYGWSLLASLPTILAKPDSFVISLENAKRSVPLDLELSVWDGTDRFWAVFAGYSTLCLLGVLYVKKGSPFSSGQVGREWEASVIDLLNQAGGVMKVILIISIEMLVFPLYCGLLLDAALLPLFENTTIMSRVLFTVKSPLTSIFVHWFVGTCYMFHFALFVSMCRKIMRKGVLYFIRDPDDPTFHPVRDVLERNVATQLRKILFSALVYGGLVVVCLGGVVWGLAFAFKGVLPIHWSSNEPVLEFPIDLLFYNFLMPLAVKFFKPSDGLHAMYSWWFRQCARMLRLTWFMFDTRMEDEEGYTVRRFWKGYYNGARTEFLPKIRSDDVNQPFVDEPELQAYLRPNGRYVRAPASDQVRIPKGTSTFLEVDESNHRKDGKRDRKEGVHGKGSKMYKQVYIPPWFRTRIFLFILSIWLFAALTGVSITIVPLVLGRQIFARIIPSHVRKNDVYAFSIGIYILGSVLYTILHFGDIISYVQQVFVDNAETPGIVVQHLKSIVARIARVVWTYTAFLFVLPTLSAFLIEFYFIVPLHTYSAIDERHIMHFVQSWTLGLLYVKLTTRVILWHEDSRPAQSLRAITRDGYLNPDARLATRSFILPFSMALTLALVYPWCLAKLAVLTILRDSPENHLVMYRYAYPMCLCLACIAVALYFVLGWIKDWRMKIRDEVYLIGERLHNFGDRKSVASGVGVPSVRRIDT